MSGSQLSLHGCKSVRVIRHTPENANALSLAIGRSNDWMGEVELLMFDLPEAETDKLLSMGKGIVLTEQEHRAVRTMIEFMNQDDLQSISDHLGVNEDEWSALMQKFGAAGDVAPDSPAAMEQTKDEIPF